MKDKSRLWTALVLVLLAAPPLFYGPRTSAIVIGIVMFYAMFEVINAKKENQWPLALKWGLVLLTLLITFYDYLEVIVTTGSWQLPANYFWIGLPTLGISALLIFLFISAILDPKVPVSDVFYLYSLALLLALGGQGALFARRLGIVPFMFVMVTTLMTDTGAYFIGIRFGKHKLNERISPKKTWEGAIGGALTGSLAGILIYLFFPFFQSFVPWYYVLFSALLISIASQFGDLSFSAVKRSYGIKDFGTIFPGHGGMLDRLDSLLFAYITFTILFAQMVNWAIQQGLLVL